MDIIWGITIVSGLTTLLGGLAVLWFGHPTPKSLAFALGLAGGIMGLVVLVQLVPAALEYGSPKVLAAGMTVGMILMYLFQKGLHGLGRQKGVNSPIYWKIGWLMALAIAFHNIPEGMAIGTGMEVDDQLGIFVALAIALHNIPEGIGVTVPFLMVRARPMWIFIILLLVGLFIPLGAFLGQLFFTGTEAGIFSGLALASGVMAYLVVGEMIPTAYRLNPIMTELGVAMGIIIMYIIQQIPGHA
ncbi:ZIP family metal transporter [Microaerobacter geothermalis]|uniref:ZIP family metal transporter n=1 Tax=Microaerobacter geothermalis TaxID=674972 RepID=UPI001F27CB35|nr:ZIP family metal transporter [Microaerobacter geothermalis]MCF6093203.1 ZIP family metal transporter [Microaerobacter geothermalis]